MSTSPLSGARAKRIVRIARTELNADAENPIDDAWVNERLDAIGATRDEYIEVYNALIDGGDATDPSPTALPTRDLEDELLRQFATERRVVAATNALLGELEHRDDTDWSSIAALLDVSEDSLRVRAGRRPGSALAVADAITISAAARTLGVARSTVYEWLDSGRLREVSIRGRRMVATDTLGTPLES